MRRHLEAALEHGLATGAASGSDHEVYAMLVDAAAQERDLAALKVYAPLAEEAALRIDHKLDSGIAHRAWGVAYTLTGDSAAARNHLEQALELFSTYPLPWQMGRTRFEMGKLARQEAKIAEARDCYRLALEAFDRLGAAPYALRTRKALDGLDHGDSAAGNLPA